MCKGCFSEVEKLKLQADVESAAGSIRSKLRAQVLSIANCGPSIGGQVATEGSSVSGTCMTYNICNAIPRPIRSRPTDYVLLCGIIAFCDLIGRAQIQALGTEMVWQCYQTLPHRPMTSVYKNGGEVGLATRDYLSTSTNSIIEVLEWYLTLTALSF